MSHPSTSYTSMPVNYFDSDSGLDATGEHTNKPERRLTDYSRTSRDSLLAQPQEAVLVDITQSVVSSEDDTTNAAVGFEQPNARTRTARTQFEIEEPSLENTHELESINVLKAWWLEIASSSISICSLLSVAVVLYEWQERPLSSWRLRYLPNSAISQLMTITRSTLMLSTASCISQLCWLFMHRKPRNLIGIQIFDGASRGPAGAAVLLLTQARSALALLGAFITITTLLMESFTQQVIQYPLRDDVGTITGSFPVTQFYAPAPRALDGGPGAPNDEANLNSSVQAAIVDSFFGISLADMYSCPTNSCSWQTSTASIGLCSSCNNVTAASNNTCSLLPEHGQKVCNYTTPLGLRLQTIHWAGEAEAGYQTRIATDARLETNHSLVSFASLTMTDTLATDRIAQTEVTECTIDWCAKVYRNASLRDRQFSAYVEEYPLLYSGFWKDNSVIGPVQPEFSLLKANSSISAGLNLTFAVQRMNAKSLANFVVRALRSGNLTESSGDAGVPGETSSLSFGAAMLDQPSISFVADKIAVSLTNAIRGLTTEYTQQAEGQSFVTTQYIRVRWVWLILPSAVVFLGIVLLGATIYESRRASIAVGKSSPLALLFHPLEGWSDTELNDVGLGDMGKSAKAMSARLTVKDGQSWRISRTSIAA